MKSIKALLGIIPLSILIAGCSNPADDVPEAAVAPAAETAEAAEGKSFAFGPETAKIEFVGSKVTGSHDGGFNKFAGQFIVANGQLADAGNKVVIDTGSIWSDNERLTRHLKSADFFEVEKYPAATFVSTSIKNAAEGATVTGNLTLHGVTKEISFPATIQVSDSEVAVTAEFFINRFDFNIKYTGKADDLIRKEVVLKLNVKAAPGTADFQSIEKAVQPAAGG